MEQGEQKITLFERLYNIMRELDYIQKDKRNTGQGYTYASEATIKRKVHELLVKYRVMFLPAKVQPMPFERVTVATRNGDQANTLVVVNFGFVFVNVDDPSDRYEGTVPGMGIDSGDKSVYKAITGALKYTFATSFVFETGDDPEKDEKPEPEQKQYMDKEERQQAKQAAQQIAQNKIQEIRSEQPKPIAPRSPVLQQALDRIKDKDSGMSVLNDWIFELGESVNPEAVINFTNFYKTRLGVKNSSEMDVEQFKQCVEMIWKKIEAHKRDMAKEGLAEITKDLPLGVGPDAPLWISKPSQAAKEGVEAHTSYIESEKKKRSSR